MATPSATTFSPPTLDDSLEILLERFSERASEHDREGTFPFENLVALRQAGLLSATVPKSVGGGGVSLGVARQVIAGIAGVEPSTALVLTMQYLFHIGIADNDRWPASLRERIQRDAVQQGALVNALRVEPELGTPARGGLPATVARRTEKGWVLSGHKLYSTGIPVLTWLGVWGRSDEEQPRTGFFLVHRDTPGIRIVESWDHLGLRASGSHEVIFEEVLIPDSHAAELRPPEEWATAASASQQAWNAVLLSALYDAIARSAHLWLLNFLRARVPSNLGAPLASLPRFQEAVGRIEALLWENSVLLDSATAAVDTNAPRPPTESNLLKYVVTNNAIKAVESALELTGNPGLSRHNPLERHYRDVLCSRIHTPQNDFILLAAGRQACEAKRRL
jgi:alkylation response protein AidB-like acyl-CoA dehydrogenase